MPVDTKSLHEELAEILPKAQHAKIPAIIRTLVNYEEPLYTVGVNTTHAGIETVELYGLEIKVDSNGWASEVTFPAGAEVLA
jgi:hypothetical protein